MKIVVSTDNYEILNSIIREAKEIGDEVVIAKLEKKLFELIELPDSDAFVLVNNKTYSQKAVDYIKRESQYMPIVMMGFGSDYSITSADIMLPFTDYNDTDFYARAILHNIHAYIKNFDTLQRLTAKLEEVIEFGDCVFDPQKRILTFKGEPVITAGKKTGKLSPKQAGIFELLAANFGKVVKKDVIMEKVWHTHNNYFVGRSLDVFVTHLRNILKENEINMAITNVSNMSLLLDYKGNATHVITTEK